MNERPLGYTVAISVSDSEGNTADFTLANTKRGTEVVAACDFPVPNDALAQTMAFAALAVCETKSAVAHLDNAVGALHASLTARLKEEAAREKRAASVGGDAPF